MSVVIAKSVCLAFLDSIRFVIVCLMLAKIMWFGQPGHQVFSAVVVRSGFIVFLPYYIGRKI